MRDSFSHFRYRGPSTFQWFKFPHPECTCRTCHWRNPNRSRVLFSTNTISAFHLYEVVPTMPLSAAQSIPNIIDGSCVCPSSACPPRLRTASCCKINSLLFRNYYRYLPYSPVLGFVALFVMDIFHVKGIVDAGGGDLIGASTRPSAT